MPSAKVTALVYLPVFYNPDASGQRKPIEDEKFILTGEEVTTLYVTEIGTGGATLHLYREGGQQGFWWDRGIVDRDVLAVLEIDIVDSEETRERLRKFARDVLLNRFRQRAIYIKWFGPIETWVVTEEEIGR